MREPFLSHVQPLRLATPTRTHTPIPSLLERLRGTNRGRKYARKLAMINGTLREGLSNYQDDEKEGPAKGPACCRNCGSIAHPTYDCELKGNHIGVPNLSVREFFDQEYAAFCIAVGEQVPTRDSSNAGDAEAAMNSFYNELDM